jgi:hypothetical protein
VMANAFRAGFHLISVTDAVMLGDAEAFDFGVRQDTGEPSPRVSRKRTEAVTHGTRVSVTIAAKIAATTPSTARGTMPIQYLGIGSSR